MKRLTLMLAVLGMMSLGEKSNAQSFEPRDTTNISTLRWVGGVVLGTEIGFGSSHWLIHEPKHARWLFATQAVGVGMAIAGLGLGIPGCYAPCARETTGAGLFYGGMLMAGGSRLFEVGGALIRPYYHNQRADSLKKALGARTP